MVDETGDVEALSAIKEHLDTHGFGSVVMNDHVVIGLANLEEGEAFDRLVRVRSLDEALSAVGCQCGQAQALR